MANATRFCQQDPDDDSTVFLGNDELDTSRGAGSIKPLFDVTGNVQTDGPNEGSLKGSKGGMDL